MGFRLDYGFSNSGVMGAVARGVLDNWRERQDKYYGDVTPIVGVTTREYYELYEKDEVLQQISEVVVEDTLENRKIKLHEPTSWFLPPAASALWTNWLTTVWQCRTVF